MNEPTFEFLEVSNIKIEYVNEVVMQHERDGWLLVKQSHVPGQDDLVGEEACIVFFKRLHRDREVPLHS